MSRWFRNVTQPLRALEELTRPPRRPFADLDVEHDYTEPGLTSDELVGVRGLLQERYEPPLAIPCPVDDCDYESSSYEDVNTHSYWDHLQPNPFETSTDPLVEHRRYPGIDRAGDFRWFNVKVTKSSASVKSTPGIGAEPNSPAASAAGDSPAGVEHPPVPPAGIPDENACNAVKPDGWCICTKPGGHDGKHVCAGICWDDHSDDAAAEWVGWAVPAISTVLHEHYPQVSKLSGRIDCDPGTENCPMWDDEQAWLEHVSPLIAVHLQDALCADCTPKTQ